MLTPQMMLGVTPPTDIIAREAERQRTLRYMKSDQPIFAQPGEQRLGTVTEGMAVRLLPEQPVGEYALVQALKPDGSPSGSPGWVKRDMKQRPKFPGQLVQFKGQEIYAGSAGQRMLAGKFKSRKPSWCAGVAQECLPDLPRGIGHAKNYINELPKHGWRELRTGEQPHPDDVVVSARGKSGHVGLIVVAPSGEPWMVSWMTPQGQAPRIDLRPLSRYTHGRVFTKRS